MLSHQPWEKKYRYAQKPNFWKMYLLVEANGYPAQRKEKSIMIKKEEEIIRQVTRHLFILKQVSPQYKGQLKFSATLFPK